MQRIAQLASAFMRACGQEVELHPKNSRVFGGPA